MRGQVKITRYRVVAQFASDSLSPPNGERDGVRGKYLKIKRLLTLVLANGGGGEKPK
jgi:hypothetical protein